MEKKERNKDENLHAFFFKCLFFCLLVILFFVLFCFFFHILFIFIFFQDEENEWMTFYKYRYVVKLLEPVPKE